MNKIATIVLAAGKGRRMKSKDVNKVVLSLGGRPMILYAIKLLESFKISPIIAVVGFAKKSVIDILKDRVVYVEQKERLGTAHAVGLTLKYLPKEITDVLVLNGDDSAFYKEETIRNLIKKHREKGASLTFLTIELDNPAGLGRVVRDNEGKLLAIIEDKDAKDGVKNIKEINPACYVFKVSFLKNYLKRIPKSKVTGEYYLTSLIDMAIKNKEKIEIVRGSKLIWRGINTMEELREAERMFLPRTRTVQGLQAK